MYLEMTEEERVRCFGQNLATSHKGYDYFIDLKKGNVDEYKKELILMTELIGAHDFKDSLRRLLEVSPSIVNTFPILLALPALARKKYSWGKDSLKILSENNSIEEYFFTKGITRLSAKEIEKYIYFAEQTGIEEYFAEKMDLNPVVNGAITSLVTMSSAGRKNRSGKAFENKCTPMIIALADKYGLEWFEQKHFKSLRNLGFDVPDALIGKRGDFILVYKGHLINIEVNSYDGQGSKPIVAMGDFINRERELKKHNSSFIYITDGKSFWNKASKAEVNNAFSNIQYMMNLHMAEDGMLEEALIEIISKL